MENFIQILESQKTFISSLPICIAKIENLELQKFAVAYYSAYKTLAIHEGWNLVLSLEQIELLTQLFQNN